MNTQFLRRSLGDWLLPGAGSVASQLEVALARAIDAGLFPTGAHLPAERDLATALAVSRSTLRTAFGQLRARGLIEARQGSGTRVAGRAVPTDRPSYTGRFRAASAINLANAVPADAARLASCAPALGADDLLRCVPADGYAPAGLESLRSRCAAYHAALGTPTRPDQIVVTTGGQRGILEALTSLTSAGDRVLVTPVTYAPALDLLEHLNLVPVPVTRDAAGPHPAALDRAIRRHRPACAFLMPAVDNPEGQTVAPARLAELAAVLDRHRLPVLEDNLLAELHHTRRRPPTFANRCRATEVVSIEAPSEVVWGGLRVGWIRAAPARVDAIARRLTLTDLGVGVPGQLLAEHVLDALPALVPGRRRQLANRSRHLRRLLSRHLPDWTPVPPAGGLSLWIRLPIVDTAPFAVRAAEHGVEVMPGTLATVGRARSDHIRLCLDRPRPILDEAIARLATAWHGHQR